MAMPMSDSKKTPPYSSLIDDTETIELPETYRPPGGVPLTRRPSVAGSFAGTPKRDFLDTSNSRFDMEYEAAKEMDTASISPSLNTKDAPSKTKKIIDALWDHFRPSFILNHLDKKSFIILSRSWIGVFVSILTTTIFPALRYQGAAAFLTIIVSVIQVPGGMTMSQAVWSSIFDLTMVIVAFTISIVSYAISWRIRGYPTIESTMQDLVTEGVCNIGDSKCLSHEMFMGRFLTTKTTVVTVFSMLFAYTIMGCIQTISIFLIPSWVFGAICTTVCGVYFNFTPYFEPWIYGSFIIVPIGFAIAIRVILAVFYFPLTSNYRFFGVIVTSLKSMQSVLNTSMEVLATSVPSNTEYDKNLAEFSKSLPRTIGSFGLLEIEGILCRAELAYSRLDPGDLGQFRSLVRMIVNSFSGCRFYFDKISEKHHSISPSSASPSSIFYPAKSDAGMDTKLAPNKSGKIHAKNLSRFANIVNFKHEESEGETGAFENQFVKRAEESSTDGMNLDDLDVLHSKIMEHYSSFYDAIHKALNAVTDWAEEANDYRLWTVLMPRSRRKRQSKQRHEYDKMKKALSHLELQFKNQRERDYKAWLQNVCSLYPFKSRQHYMFFLSMDSFYECSLERLARGVQRAAAYCVFLDESQPEPCWIYPFMKTRSKVPRFESEYMARGALGADFTNLPTAFVPSGSKIYRNPDSSGPQNRRHLFGLMIQEMWWLINSPKLIFNFKRALAPVVCCFTYFARTTAFWSYNYRILWVAIMAALTVSAKAVDGVYGVCMKEIFTFFGALIGMLVWYIGDGHGDGNPYGFTAAMSGAMVFLLAYRHFHQLAVPMGAVVMVVTTVLVASVGFTDSILQSQDIKLGYGFRIAWIRFVSVTVGLLIATIFTFLPKPVTAKKEIRKVLGEALETFGECHASIANFALQRQSTPEVHITSRSDAILKNLRITKSLVLTAQKLSKQIRYEPPLGGVWPRHKFELLTRLIWDISFLLEDIYFFLDNVKHHQDMPMVLQLMAWTNTDITSGLYSVLVLNSRGLISGNPLPSITPGYLSDLYSRYFQRILDSSTEKENLDEATFLEDRFLQHDGRLALAMILSISAILKRVDGSIRLCKDLVGEMFGIDQELYNYDDRVPLLWTSPLSATSSDDDS